MILKIWPSLVIVLLLITLLPASAESIWISSPSDGVTFGDETITLYAQISNSSMPVPFIKYSHDPSEAPPMTYWGSDIYIYNVNFSEFPDGSWSILVSSGPYTDSINITKESTTTTPTPTPTPEPPRYLHITGLTDGDSYDNSSLFFIVYNNDTMEPVNQPVWYLWYQNRIVNTGTGYFSGRCNIEWVDDYANPLDDGAYLIQIKSDGYEPAEFLVSLESPEPPVNTGESMTVFGLDKRVADDVTLWIYVMDKTTSDRYIEDVTVKVLDQAGTTITSLVTDVNGRVLINWQEITGLAAGEYSQYAVEFTKPGYNRKVVDTMVVSSIPTPTPTPTPSPTPTPASTPAPVQTANPSSSSVSATTQDEVDRANSNIISSSFPSLLIIFTLLSGGGLCFAVIFPDQTKGARDFTVRKLKETGRSASKANREQDMMICSATDQGPTGIETKCQNPAVPGTRYCLEHARLATGGQAAQSPHVPPPVGDTIPIKEQPGTPQEAPKDEPEGVIDEATIYDQILMDPEVVMMAYNMVLNNISDNDIKAKIEERYMAIPSDDWLKEVHIEVDKTTGEPSPEGKGDGTHG